MIGISALTCFIFGLSMYYQMPFINLVAFCIVSIGLVASSRLYMKAHTYPELIVWNNNWSWTTVVFISILVIKYKKSNQFSMLLHFSLSFYFFIKRI